MVNHSHSCGPARWLPGPANGLCKLLLPNPFAKLRLLELGCMDANPVLEPIGLDTAAAAAAAAAAVAASLEPVELSGLSMSMLLLLLEGCCSCSTTTLLL